MDRRNADIETVPHRLEDRPERPRIQTDAVTFANIVTNFRRRNGGPEASGPVSTEDAPLVPATEPGQAAQEASKALLYKHWNAIKAQGITASQFIAFLQPLANLDGIAVSYTWTDEDGDRQVYSHRREELSEETPLSRAIREKTVTREKALSFALNAEGRVWIESNFIELK